MTKENEIYKCEICGDTVSVILEGAGNPSCCGKPMTLLREKTAKEEGKEKHVPVVEIKGNSVKVKIGSIPHPMEAGHHITLVQLLRDGKIIAGKRLYPGEKPEAEFYIENPKGVKARELCNIHGLWRN
jgi:superoxide reductase